MRNCFIWLISLIFLSAAGCSGPTGAELVPARERTPCYTQVNFWAENGVHQTTNYRTGVLIPVNTRVHIEAVNGDRIVIRLPDMDNIRLTVVNVEPYTQSTIDGIFSRLFGPEPVDLSGFGPFAADIQNGVITKGMTKDGVRIARGYPPAHKTGSLKLNTWKYWKNRFNTISVVFDVDGNVMKIIN